jgi:hypothetical protein
MKSTDIDQVLYPSNFLPQAIRLVIKLKEAEFKKQKNKTKQRKTKKLKRLGSWNTESGISRCVWLVTYSLNEDSNYGQQKLSVTVALKGLKLINSAQHMQSGLLSSINTNTGDK